jgi:hypothetical protein
MKPISELMRDAASLKDTSNSFDVQEYPFTYARQAVIARSRATKQSLILRSQIKEIASLRSQ